ncbi:MAG TPA: MerR family transcriptional regulator [Chitinispirillaceae bacterium]|nr:MerR family transcriptional regulator [Chitinispirillaceae bacterium]
MDLKKMYYSISEVCKIIGLEPHVLRYWESEFTQLRPKKNRAGNRAYREKDIELVKYIKHLLYEEKFTIPGAKKKLSENGNNSEKAPVQTMRISETTISIEDIKKQLREIYTLLTS